MQLTIEVLPAPLGPMIENSSPSLTPKLTSVSARTPPKRSDTPRTSKACSTHSLRNCAFRRRPDCAWSDQGAWHALYLASGKINPVRRDRSTGFSHIGMPAVAVVASAAGLTRSALVLDFTGVECYGLRRGQKASGAPDLAGPTGAC